MHQTSGVAFVWVEVNHSILKPWYWKTPVAKIISVKPLLQNKVDLNPHLKKLRNLSLAFTSSCPFLQNTTFPIQIFLGLKDTLPRKKFQNFWMGKWSQQRSWLELTASNAALVQCFIGCIICSWGWLEWENFGSIHRKWIFPDWLIPCWLSSIFLSTSKTFCLVCSSPRPLETVGVFFFSLIFSTSAKCVRS